MSKTAAAVRERVREPAAELAAKPQREAVRKPANQNVMTWTDPNTGEVFSRSTITGSDNVLDFPPELVPEGYTYAWVRKSVYNQEDRANIVSRNRNGWRNVPADRYADRVVEYEGLILMECPTVFVEQAREEERNRAMTERKTSLPGMNLPGGFDANHSGARQNTFARVGTPVPSDPAWRAPYKPSIDIDS